jgi:hypothetical protein
LVPSEQVAGCHPGGNTSLSHTFHSFCLMRTRTYYFVAAALLPFVLLVLRAIFGGPALPYGGSTHPTAADPEHVSTTCNVATEVGQNSDQEMVSSASLGRVASSLLAERDLELVSCNAIQSLWAGYGHVCSVQAVRRGSGLARPPSQEIAASLILKYVSAPVSANATDEGHLRKVLSYQVEQYFYTHLAPLLPESVAVPECIASINDGKTTAVVLKDLKSSNSDIGPALAFPVALEKRSELDSPQTFAALNWLAGFHGHFWGDAASRSLRDGSLRPPLDEAAQQRRRAMNGTGANTSGAQFDVRGIWLNGGYTYLATRRNEYASLARDQESEWSKVLCTPSPTGGPSLAERVAAYLAPSSDSDSPSLVSKYETLIHGDVKSENMFASASGEHVAFVDFQYVGLGLGVCDLAKLFTCSVSLTMLLGGEEEYVSRRELAMQPGERRLLRHYLQRLQDVSGRDYPWDDLVKHWEVALVDWLRFQASWGFWGNTEWLEARVRHVIKGFDI